MGRKLTVIVALAVIGFFATTAYASDWDKAGKVLTGVEGLRLVTGGRVDLIGNIFGLNNHRNREYAYNVCRYRLRYHKVWVPYYAWKKKYIPQHTEYNHHYGEVIVEGHYIRYKTENGGHWELVRR